MSTDTGIITLVMSAASSGGNISGSAWTPARDGSGNVFASDLQSLPLNSWLYVVGANASLNSAIQTPHYWRTEFGADSAPGIVDAWSGAAWDWQNNVMYITGGGHGDSSMLENGVYAFDARKMSWSRVKDRSLPSAWQRSEPNGSWTYVNPSPTAANGTPSAGTTFNNPLADNAPTATHTYHQLVWVPPSVMGGGNIKGGFYQGGSTRGVLDLDTAVWRPLHFYKLTTSGADWASYVCAFLDNNAVYHLRGGDPPQSRYKFTLSGSEPTDWTFAGQDSFGVFANMGSQTGFKQKDSAFVELRERREHVYFSGDQRAHRIRHGQMIDAGSSNWDSYTDLITLTSTDGSHLDFNSNAFFNNDVFYPPVPGASNFTVFGAAYDHDTQAIYVAPNYTGSRMYKITGLNTSAWNVEKLPVGTGVLSSQAHQTNGRFRIATVSGVKIAVRVSSTTRQTEVCRLT